MKPSHHEVFLHRLNSVILKNLHDDQFSVERLAHEIGISRSQLHRRVRRQLHKTINEHIREIRLEEAMKLLKSADLTAAEISYRIGFSSPTYFNKCFHDHYGYPPGEVKKLMREGKLDEKLDNTDKTGIDLPRGIDQTLSKSRAKFSRKMIGWILLLFLVFLFSIYLLFKPEVFQVTKKIQAIDKSIAVLPLRKDSSDPDSEYFCNGMMEEILDKLQNIDELKVLSRTATERYRNTTLDPRDIARELNVSHILQGSVRKWENKFRVSVQLINAKTGFQIWSDIYEKEMEDVFAVQADIAIKVSEELKIALTINEKQQIVSDPTVDVTAYDYILRARDEKWKYWFFDDTVALKNAERLYDKALKLDPNYAPGWTAKGSIYYDLYKHSEEYYEENYLDSVLWYCEKADQIDPGSSVSSDLKAMVYHHRGDIKRAIHHYEKAIKNTSGDSNPKMAAMWRLGSIYIYNKDYQKGISLFRKAVQISKGSPKDYAYLLSKLAYSYLWIGDYEKAENCYIQSRDMGAFFLGYPYFYFYQGDFQEALDCLMSHIPSPSKDWDLYLLGDIYFQSGDFENAVKYYRQFVETREARNRIQWDNLYREGIALIELGMKVEGMKLIEKQLSQLEKRKKLGRSDGYDYHLAAISANRGDQEKALQYLRDYNNKVFYPDHIIIPLYFAQYDVMFRSLWNNPEFKALLKQDQDEKAVIRAQIREAEEQGELDL